MPHPAPLSSMFLRHLAPVDEERDPEVDHAWTQLTRATHTAQVTKGRG